MKQLLHRESYHFLSDPLPFHFLIVFMRKHSTAMQVPNEAVEGARVCPCTRVSSTGRVSQGWPNYRLFVGLGECVNDGGKTKMKKREGAGGLLHLDHSCTQHDSHTPTLTQRYAHTCTIHNIMCAHAHSNTLQKNTT